MKATVIMTCYNHEKTVEKAIRSVLSQKTDFDYHIVIVDDCSTDGSLSIIERYHKEEARISVIQHVENMGTMQSYLNAFNYCIGEYIFFCETDDYWSSVDKIQQQINYMDKNPDCGFCTHRVMTRKNDTIIDNSLPGEIVNGHTTFDNLLRGNNSIYAQSYCIRRSVFNRWINFEFFARHFNVFDYPIVLELIHRTRFHQLDFYGAIFCIHGESITQTRKRSKRLKLVLGYAKIRAYYILKFGCKPSTLVYITYRFTRDILSVVLKKWNG